jgi:predicted N-acyltransferase
MLTVEIVDSLWAVDPDEWARVAGGHGLYSTRDWLLMGEAAPELRAAEDWAQRYVLCRADGLLLGALPLYEAGVLRSGLYDPVTVHADFVGADADPGRWAPDVIAGSRTGYRNPLLFAHDVPRPRRQEALELLVQAAVAVARKQGAGAVSFPYLTPRNAAVMCDILGPSAVSLVDAVKLVVPVPATFEDYLGTLSRNRRTAVRRERDVFRASGATVRRTGLAEARDVVSHLYANLLAKYGGRDAEARAADYIGRQTEFVADRSVVWLCERAGQPVAFSLFYEVDDVLFSRFVGFDYTDASHFEYFNLLFYEPMEYACGAGLKAVDLSVDTAEAKIRRGAHPQPLWSVLLPAAGSPPDDAAARARELDDATLAKLARNCASWMPNPPDTADWAPPGWSSGGS